MDPSLIKAGCKKSEVVHSSSHLNHLKFYQKIAKALASHKRVFIQVLDSVDL